MAAAADINTLITCLHEALRTLHVPNRLANTLLCASPLVENYCKNHLTFTPPHALINLLDELLATLATKHPQYVDLLYGHFWEGLTVDEMVARQRPEAQSNRRFHQLQHNALAHLAQTWQEAELHLQEQTRRQQLLQELPVSSYDSLFGVEPWIEQALDWLNDRKAAPILTLKGNGGIGKTALADCIVRRAVETSDFYQRVIWISAKQEYLTSAGVQSLLKSLGKGSTKVSLEQIFNKLAQTLGLYEICGQPIEQQIERLAALLRKQPHLIVIDNLESVSDFAQLTPLLERLVTPTRFILTSRQTTSAPFPIQIIELDELSQPATHHLIEHTAQQKGVSDCDSEHIYDLVGGNPLAILLLVSQLRWLPAEQVFNNLRNCASEQLYHYIYWNSWRVLQPPAPELLFTIQRTGDQADWRWLRMGRAEPACQTQQALEKLLDLSLVNLRGRTNGNHLYGIHRLTSTFLRNEVLGWK